MAAGLTLLRLPLLLRLLRLLRLILRALKRKFPASNAAASVAWMQSPATSLAPFRTQDAHALSAETQRPIPANNERRSHKALAKQIAG